MYVTYFNYCSDPMVNSQLYSLHGRGDVQWLAFVHNQFCQSGYEYLCNLTCKFNHNHERCIGHPQCLICFVYCFNLTVSGWRCSLHWGGDFGIINLVSKCLVFASLSPLNIFPYPEIYHSAIYFINYFEDKLLSTHLIPCSVS